MEVRQEISAEVHQNVRPLQQELENQKTVMENQQTVMENQQTVMENQQTVMANQKVTFKKLQERFSKVERPLTITNQTSYNNGQAAAMVGKPSTFKIPTFDGTGPWKLYHMQFEAAAVRNQWADMEKGSGSYRAPQGAALSQSNTSEYTTQVQCLGQRFGQKPFAPVKRRELKNRKQQSVETLQDYAANIRRLAQEVYRNMDPNFVEGAAVDSFVDGIRN